MRKIPPAVLAETVGRASVWAFASEVKRSVASHEDAKAHRFAGRSFGAGAGEAYD